MGIVLTVLVVIAIMAIIGFGIVALVYLILGILASLPISLPIIWILMLSISNGWHGFWLALVEVVVVYGLFFTVIIGGPMLVEKIKAKKEQHR